MKFLEMLKNKTAAAIKRLFHSRTKKYDELLGRMDSLLVSVSSTSSVLPSTESVSADDGSYTVEIEGDIIKRSNKNAKTKLQKGGVFAIDHFESPPKAELLKFTDMFNDADEYMDEIEGMMRTLEAKVSITSLKGHKIERRFSKLSKEKLSKIKGVSKGKSAVTSTSDTLTVVITSGHKAQEVLPNIKKYVREAVKASPMNLGIKYRRAKVGRNEAVVISFTEKGKFDAADKAFLDNMQSYYTSLSEKREEAQEALHDLAEKHVPDSFVEIGGVVYKHINNSLDASLFNDLSEYLYVTTNSGSRKGDTLEFTHYFHVDGLDAEEFSSEDFIIAVTGSLRRIKSKYTMHISITSMNKFKRPGDFVRGKEIEASDVNKIKSKIQREVTHLLSMHGIQSAFHRRKLNITVNKLRKSGVLDIPGVIDARPRKDGIYILVNNLEDDIIREEIFKEVLPILNRVIGMRRTRNSASTSWMHTISETKSGNKMLVIIKVNDVS